MLKIDALLDDLVTRGGTDLHLGAGYPPIVRIRGELVPTREGVLDPDDLAQALFELLSPAQQASLQANLDLQFTHPHGDSARFRANYFHRSSGLAAVLHLVPLRVPTLAELGCPEVVSRLADRRAGLVLVTGPTGSGKTTTLAAMVDHINKTRSCHILTIEEPLEFVHEPVRAHVTHREVGHHAPSFEAAMQSAEREDPDVVLVSDLRGAATIRSALQLASQGILVLASTPTNGAGATIDRLIGAFSPGEQPQARAMLAESLLGIVSQHLLRPAEGTELVAAREILLGSAAVSGMVREAKTTQLAGIMQAGQALGMQTMDMALERLLAANRISAEDALERAVDREQFARVIARLRPDLAHDLG